MNTPPDFSKYTKQLNIEQLKNKVHRLWLMNFPIHDSFMNLWTQFFKILWTVSLSQMAKVMF